MSSCELDVIAAGHLCLDMFPKFTTGAESGKIGDILRPGTLVHMGGVTFGTGGAVSNTGIAMKIFGNRVGFVAKVGDDTIGKIIIDIVRSYGSADGIKVSEGEASSYTVVLSPPGIDRIFLHCPGTNDTLTADDVDASIVSKARLIHFGYPTLMRGMFVEDGAALVAIFARAKEAGVTTSLDISLPDPNSEAGKADWRCILERSLPYTDIFAPSIEEAFFTLHRDEYLARKAACGGDELIDYITPEEVAGIADAYLSMGCRIVALKAGHNGWYVKSSDTASVSAIGAAAPADCSSWAGREIWCPAFQVDEIATATGAGDSAIGGFLTGLLRGQGLEESLKMANCAGYCNLQGMDSLSGLKSWDAMQSMIPGLTVSPDPDLSGVDGWLWDEARGIWERG